MPGLLLVWSYALRVLPGLLLVAASFIFLRPSAALRIVLYILGFILLRDAMTPMGLWELGSQSGVLWIRLSDDPVFLILFGLSSLGITAGIYFMDQENRGHISLFRANPAAGVITGILGSLVIVLPIYLMYRSIPLAIRGGEVVRALFLPLLVFAIFGNLLEELLFRGYALGKLSERFGPWKSAVLSGLLFALCHVFLAISVTNVGSPLLIFTLWEGILCGLIGVKFGVIPATLAHGGAIFILSSGLL